MNHTELLELAEKVVHRSHLLDSDDAVDFLVAAHRYIRSPEFAAMVKDAERYRWLRGAGFEFIQIGGKSLTVSTSDTGLDYAIDAAIDAELKP